MAIGVNWKEIWSPVWKAVWTFDAPTPPVVNDTPTAAGISRKHKQRRRFFVDIDGQQFDVASVEEARQLLQRAKTLAEAEAPKVAERTAQRIERIGTAPKIEVPKISASPELAEIVYPYRKAIQKAYSDAAQTAELRMLLEAKFRQDDDDDIFILMM